MLNKKQVLYAVVMVALVLQLVSLSTDDWLVNKSHGTTLSTKMGLWNKCVGDNCTEINVCTDPMPNSLNAVRALTVLAVVLAFCSCCCMYNGTSMGMGMGMKPVHMLAGAGLACIVATIVYVKEFKDAKQYKDLDLGYSFHLNWVAGVLLLGAAGYQYMG